MKKERKYVRGEKAKNNKVVNFKSMSKKTVNLKGRIFNRLTVLEYLGLNHRRHAVWKCKCICGNYFQTSAYQLKSGNVKSCGCLTKERIMSFNKGKYRVTVEDGGLNNVYLNTKNSAKYRNLDFKLSKSQIKDIIRKNCYYCDSPPLNVVKMGSRSFLYSGIDRIDSKIGYIIDNCVPCCKVCNLMKKDHSLDFFVDHLEKILNFYKKKVDIEE